MAGPLRGRFSSQGFLTVGLEFQDVPKLSSLAKSMIHMSLLQLDAVARPFAILDEIIGVLFDGNPGTASLFAHILPTAPKQSAHFHQ